MKKRVLFIIIPVIFILFSSISNRAEDKQYVIKISVTKCRLWLLEKQINGNLITIREYQAGTAKMGLPRFPLGEGVVTKIERNPIWHPTAYTRSYLAKKGQIIPEAVPAGNPLNYMGSFRISLSHYVPGKGAIYRIHGVRPGDEWTVGKRISGGCIRMHDSEGEELIQLVTVGTRVIIEM